MTALHTGDKLDDYRIENVAARSGMASIFRATDERTGQTVAIKVPHPEMEADPVFYDRFQREQQIGEKLDHPNVMKVFPNGDHSQFYMAMEWVDGRLLRQILNEQRKFPPERAINIALQIARALEYIHTQGVVHRDLKPENIMVDKHDRIKLIDFGIAANVGSKRLTFAKFTQTMGTPDYISPEQVKGKRGDARSDIYALGVMLYEMLTGKVPFTGSNAFTIMNDRLLNNPVPPREIDPSISPQMQEIIYRAIERDPGKRYQSAREFVHDLQHPETVGVADREELTNWKVRRQPRTRQILFYVAMALIPVVIFAILLWVAKHT
ncbi:MAG TPA: serine/threonine-protein kinase [Terriglobales bacterium]|nr:serine/threonine-protein kinase [Terriglobales bacterium]